MAKIRQTARQQAPASSPPRRRPCGRVIVWLAAALLAGSAAAAPGEPPAPPQPEAPEPPAQPASAPAAAPVELVEIVNAAPGTVRAMAVWLARGVDSWFGDRPFEDGGKVSDGRLSVSLLKRQHESADVDVRFNARFRLPNLEEKTYLFFGRDDSRELLTDRPGALSHQERLQAQSNAERAFFFGLGRSLNDSIDFRLGLRSGLRAYVQGRYRTQWEVGADGLAELRQTVFWSVADRAGSTTAFSYEHLFSPVWAARWLTSATITQASERFEWTSLLGAYRSFGHQRLLSVEGIVDGKQGSGVGATDYGLQTRWEQPVHHDWLIGGLVIGRFWPRPDVQTERRGIWAMGVNLRMRF